jgi:neutral ceramidase
MHLPDPFVRHLFNRAVALLFGLAALVQLTTGCATISGRIEAPVAATPQGVLLAGAAKTDLTPPPGYPMGGHSVGGATAQGYWTRLRARAIYVEDAEGRCVVLVSCDLWSMPAGLADRVAELVSAHADTRHVGREQLILAATHTHHSPGNFSSCAIYNEHGSPRSGFDKRLFEFLAQRIANAVRQAVHARRPARIHVAESQIELLARNRSLPAFISNPESSRILGTNANLRTGQRTPEFPALEAYHAVDPRLRVLRIEAEDGDRETIAVAAFFAVHPTVMNPRSPFYQSDLTGAATTLVEQRWVRQGDAHASPVVAFFNGAEGDVSSDWREQKRSEVLRLGLILAEAILRHREGGLPVTGPVLDRFSVAPLANVRTNDAAIGTLRTASQPLLGASALGGAEDGRTALYFNGNVEGMTGDPSPDHGLKLPALDPRWLWFRSLIPWTRIAMGKGSVPRVTPLHVVRLGGAEGLVLATLPGEFTTVMGHRVARWIADRASVRPQQVLLIGLANEYVSYFTTPEEYALQHYEGASTLYGPHAGALVGLHLARLGSPNDGRDLAVARDFKYRVGGSRRFGPATLKGLSDAAARRSLTDLFHEDRTCEFEWTDRTPRLDTQNGVAHPVTPQVELEQLSNGSWRPLRVDGVVESDEGLRFATLLKEVRRDECTWRVAWLPPAGFDSDVTLRFRVQRLNGGVIHSPVFTPSPDARNPL